MNFQDQFSCQDGKVYLGGKSVGWYHINKTSGQIKATAKIGNHTTIVFGYTEYECSRLLERQHSQNQSQND